MVTYLQSYCCAFSDEIVSFAAVWLQAEDDPDLDTSSTARKAHLVCETMYIKQVWSWLIFSVHLETLKNSNYSSSIESNNG